MRMHLGRHQHDLADDSPAQAPPETYPPDNAQATGGGRHTAEPVVGGAGAYRPEPRVAKRRVVAAGPQIGTGLCGFLAAVGVYTVIAAVVGAVVTRIGTAGAIHIGDALNVARVNEPSAAHWNGAIALLVLAFIAFLAGGYVSGTMARARGLVQGFSVWLWGAVAAVVVSLIVEFSSMSYAALYEFDLFPRIHVGSGTGMATAIVSAIVFAAAGLLGALVGGLMGKLTHRRVRVAEPTPSPRG